MIKQLSTSFSIVMIASIFVSAHTICFMHQEKVPEENATDSEKRLTKLENRVERLERLIFNEVSLSVFDAERQLAEAQTDLENSERLFAQGFITDAQVSQDRYIYERAKRELDLAKADVGGRRIVTEIELLRAQRNLDVANQQLQFSERLNVRGYASKTQIKQLRRLVDQRTKELQVVQEKLDAVNQMQDEYEKTEPNDSEKKRDQ